MGEAPERSKRVCGARGSADLAPARFRRCRNFVHLGHEIIAYQKGLTKQIYLSTTWLSGQL